jgi:predicted nucleic acid-binding protein
MEHIVVDSNIIVASFLQSDYWYREGQEYITGLENGDYLFHLPMLVVVEVTSAISRRAQRERLAILTRARKSIADWERDGKLVLYPLDRDRMVKAIDIAIRDRLKGPDSVIAALAEELSMPLRTFDTELQQRFTRAQI